MEIREICQSEKNVGYICDACGRECYKSDEPYSTEHAKFSAQWGYWSDNKDMDAWDCDLCEGCAEKVRQFIEQQLGGRVRVIQECRRGIRLGAKEDRDYIVKSPKDGSARPQEPTNG